jgi:hypothetical protein
LTTADFVTPAAGAGRRGLGWLLGPPPERGSPQEKLRNGRLLKILLVFQLALVWYFGILRYSIYDEKGEFAPRVWAVAQGQEEEDRAAKELQRQFEEELIKAKHAKLLKDLKVPVPLLTKKE